jgi:hypothetical protein
MIFCCCSLIFLLLFEKEINVLGVWNPTIVVPNPWRAKAQGKILCNVPITLYCNDTSGDQSKKWNKHISYYFTLSGLPPKLSNQQFNFHFLCTSNITGALELGEMVVEQLKYDILYFPLLNSIDYQLFYSNTLFFSFLYQ